MEEEMVHLINQVVLVDQEEEGVLEVVVEEVEIHRQ